MPDLSTYRPSDERAGGRPPPIELRHAPPRAVAHAARQHGARGRRAARAPRRWLRIAGWTLAGIGVLGAGAVALAVTFAPTGIIRDQLVRVVKARTGRDLVIAGRTSLSVFPNLAVSMGDVTLSAPPGMGGAPLVRMRRLEADVALMPLLGRRVAIDRLVLAEPVIELRVDSRGRRSWDFAELAGPRPVTLAQVVERGKILPPELKDFLENATPREAGPQTRTAPGRGGGLEDIALGDIRIENGTIKFRDERSGLAEEVRAINVRLLGTSLAAQVSAKGDLELRGDRIDFDGRVSSPKALIEERPTRLALTIGSPKGHGRYEGAVKIVNSIPQLDGRLKLDTPSVLALAGWIGAPVSPGPTAGTGLGAISIEGEVKNGLTWLSLADARLKLDAITGTGTVNVDLVGGRPHVKAQLRLAALDLNPYLQVEPAEGSRGIEAQPPAGQAPQRPAQAPAGPQVRGFNQRSGWSEVPIDLAMLGIADADVRLSMGRVAWREMKLGTTDLTISLKGRALRTTIDDVRLYGGQGRGTITMEPSGKSVATAANLTLDVADGHAMLKDMAGFDWIAGRAKVQLAVGGSGGTQKAIMEGLNGKAEIGLVDGAIVGYDITQMIQGLSQGRVPGLARVPGERTPFTDAGASFQLRGGIAETKDLRVVSAALRLTGAGTIDVGRRQVDMTLRPRLVSAAAGAPAAGELGGLELPVRVRGPWERTQIAADMDALLKNPNQVIDTLRQIGKQIQEGKGGELNQLIDRFRRR